MEQPLTRMLCFVKLLKRLPKSTTLPNVANATATPASGTGLVSSSEFVEGRDDVIPELVGGYVVVHCPDSVECIGSNERYSNKPTPSSYNIELPPIRCKASDLALQEESVSISTCAAIRAAKIRAVNTHRTTLQTKKQLL